jgi:glycopeptide antibiotics resistance protein
VTTRQRYLATRIAYVGIVVLATLADLGFSGDLAKASERLVRAFTPSLEWRDAIDALRNVVLFAGLGTVWVMTSASERVGGEVWRATLAGFALSVTVEGLQVFSPVRIASIVDVTTNTIGAFGGAAATILLLAAVRKETAPRSYVGVPAILLAGPYALAVLCEALTPLFHSVALEGMSGGPLTRLELALRVSVPLHWSEVVLTDIPLFAAAGFLCTVLLREIGRDSKHASWAVALVGGLLVLGAHVAHGMSGLQIRWEAATIDVLSVALGAWMARRWLSTLTLTFRDAALARAAIFSYAALLVLWGWRPLLPELRGDVILAQLNADQLVPLRSLSARVDVFSATHVVQQFLLYIPLGALLAVWPLRLTGRWAHLWPAVWLAIVIELGHLIVVDRTLDTTNAMLACAGIGIGWVAAHRCGFRPVGEALDEGRGKGEGGRGSAKRR